MGLFDIFKGKKGGGSGTSADKWAERAGDKRAQAYDRQEAINELANLGTKEAAAALLKRFTFVVDPSITDQEEKEVAFQGVLKAGRAAIEPIRTFSEKAESLAWPTRILKEIMTEEEFITELTGWLSKWDTEYAKFIDPKLQLLLTLEDYKSDKVRDAVLPFLEDVNEPARYHATLTLLAQAPDDSIRDALLTAFAEEESMRIKTKIVDAFIAREWAVPEEARDATKRKLPDNYGLGDGGMLQKRW
ncbi:MAG: HEAT repeat domain-containing protein [Polyangiaceae bacterium]